MTDNPITQQLPQPTHKQSPSFLSLLFHLPFSIISLLLKLVLYRPTLNPLMPLNTPCGGTKQACFAKEYSVSKIKEKCKEHGCTLNDLIMTVISMTVKQYFIHKNEKFTILTNWSYSIFFIKKGDEKTREILLMAMISIRSSVYSRFGNKFVAYPIYVPLCNDFQTALKSVQGEFTRLKQNTIAIKGMYYLTLLVMMLPKQAVLQNMSLFILQSETQSTKPALYCTNIFVGADPCAIEGVKTRKISTLIPSMQDVTGGFVISTLRDIMWLSFTSDEARCKEAKEIIAIFERTLDSVIN